MSDISGFHVKDVMDMDLGGESRSTTEPCGQLDC